jgi:hypothetical protein
MRRRLKPLLQLVLAIAAAVVVFDAVVFRSGLYARMIAFDSTAGSVVTAVQAIDRNYDPARRNVLVLGDSRIGQGFSARVADAATARTDLHFIDGSVAGTTPRVWSYLLREVDPQATRFAAIVLMVDYDERHQPADLTNYAADTSYLEPLLRLSDFVAYPATFTATDQRERARRAIAFPLLALQDDVRALLAHPLRRLHEIRKLRPRWIADTLAYRGREGRLPDLALDPASGMPSDWGSDPAANRARFADYFRRTTALAAQELQAANARYASTWIGAIARRYRGNVAPVIVFSMPRGPWAAALNGVPSPGTALRTLIEAQLVTALPGDAFTDLEQPRYFFDLQHLNRDGRERFTPLLAGRVAALVR